MKRYLWSLTLFLYIGLIILLKALGRLSTYLHPKMHMYLYVAGVILVVLLMVEVRQMMRGHSKKVSPTIIVFFVPLLMGIFLSFSGDHVINTKKGIEISAAPSTKQTIEQEQKPSQNNHDFSTDEITVDTSNLNPDYASEYKDEEEQRGAEDFYKKLTLTYTQLDDLIGKEITMVGFVYRDESIDPSQFVIARQLMICCAADSSPYGLLSEYDGADDLYLGEWVEVHGILEKAERKLPNQEKSIPIPKINVLEIKPAEAASNSYIYPE